MCGRYTLRARLNQLLQIYAAESDVELEPRYNIAPTQDVATVRSTADSATRELALLHWGLIPSWADDPKIGNHMINARGETVAEKPSFRTALKRRRCLVLADGFYEWKKEGKAKQPHFIRMKDDGPIAFAGLWEHWRKNGLTIESCTIITTSANKLMSELHDRMPVILSGNDIDLWLDQKVEDSKTLLPMLDPYPDEEMETYPVSTLVNSPKNESSECIEPLAE
ncbi:SOS response-associated peptidase [Bremerella cremea]|uniref:Abasic site processing protein n=2 Tax=Bremerella cremea TaxID=1031537 RepID=A0A368KU50_9BACT|nr:SOS response-associated peptidase [Bremerella cremea]